MIQFWKMKVSIITVSFNAEKTIGTTIESVLKQKLGEGDEIEYIVVDGKSSDGTVEVVKRLMEKAEVEGEGGRLSFRWVSEKDEGLYDAMNKGIAMASGDVVGIVNADDALADDQVIARIIKGFDSNTDIVYGDVKFVAGGTSLEELRKSKTVRYCTGKYFKKWMFRFATFPAHPSTFVRRECFEKYGKYSLNYPICADFELMLRLFCKHGLRAKYVPVCTTVMRRGGASTAGIRSNIAINNQDLRALKANGYWSALPIIYLKYMFKVAGYFRR